MELICALTRVDGTLLAVALLAEHTTRPLVRDVPRRGGLETLGAPLDTESAGRAPVLGVNGFPIISTYQCAYEDCRNLAKLLGTRHGQHGSIAPSLGIDMWHQSQAPHKRGMRSATEPGVRVVDENGRCVDSGQGQPRGE